MRKAKYPRSIILAVALYLVAAFSAAVTQQNWEFLKVYIPFFVIVAGVVALMHARVNFSNFLLWCFAFWGAVHFAGGLVRLPDGWNFDGENQVLYSWWVAGQWLKYDHCVHTFGFGACTWLTWEALRASVQQRLGRKLFPSLGMIALCIFAGMGLGALNEIIEFIAVLIIPETNVGGYVNTGWDLVANLTGCLFAGILILFRG